VLRHRNLHTDYQFTAKCNGKLCARDDIDGSANRCYCRRCDRQQSLRNPVSDSMRIQFQSGNVGHTYSRAAQWLFLQRMGGGVYWNVHNVHGEHEWRPKCHRRFRRNRHENGCIPIFVGFSISV
jgi:hypothetical protein